MNIRPVPLSREYKDQLFDMLEEWKKAIEENKTNRFPYVIFKEDFHNFDHFFG